MRSPVITVVTVMCALVLPQLRPAAAQSTDSRTAPLSKYLGTWTYEGEGNGGRVSCRSERRWIANQAFVESHRDCTTPNGAITQVEVYGYDSRRGLYVYWGFNGGAVSTYTSPSLRDTIVWTGEGYSAANRCTDMFASDGHSSTAQCETTSDGGRTWQRVSGGVSKRAP